MNTLPDILQEAEEEFSRAFPGDSLDPLTDTEARLDWLLERIANRQAEIATNNAIADRRKLQIEDWRQGENAKIERSIDWFNSQIRQLVPIEPTEFEQQFGKRSRTLPFGTIGYRKMPDTIEVFNPERALEWAKARGQETKIIPASETVSKTVLKAALKQHTDPDGFEVIRGLDEFYVKPDDHQTKGH